MIELCNALKFITVHIFIQNILTFNLGVAFLKSVSIEIICQNTKRTYGQLSEQSRVTGHFRVLGVFKIITPLAICLSFVIRAQ